MSPLSDDILPSQVPLQEKYGNDFCTKRDLLDKYTPEEKRMEYEYRKHIMKWVLIDAIHIVYNEYIVLLFGRHPQTYWYPLIKAAYAMAMSYFRER